MSNFLKKLWKIITYVRMGLANVFFIIFVIFFIVILTSGPGREPIPNSAPLFISFKGFLVDRSTYEPTVMDLFNPDMADQETIVRNVVYAINTATSDKRINALILNLSPLVGGGISKIEEIGQAIEKFQASGKPVYAYSDDYSQQQYLLASYADEIYINKLGTVALTGFGLYRNFYKDAADKLSVKFHVFRVGNYKDAVEPYIRNDMSDASREHNASWISTLWKRYTSKIEAKRSLAEGSIDSMIANIEQTLAEQKISQAQLALASGYVDHVVSRNQMDDIFKEKFGEGKDPGSFNGVGLKQYLADVKPILPSQDNNIGLIVASGSIVGGEGAPSQIGGRSMSNLIEQASNDKSLKALIIRIDSGGGSAFASEVIRDEIATARAKGLPIYISMGSVAASGGYWIATDAEEVWATPTTITGSIGVFGLIPNLTESFERLGIHSDGVGTTGLADIYEIDRPLSPKAQVVIQSSVDNIYREFLSLVSNARGISVEQVHEIAQGRVWIGEKALALGLVDQLGSLNDLMEHVAQQQGISGYHVKPITRPLSTLEQVMLALEEQARVTGDAAFTSAINEKWSGLSKLLGNSEMNNIIQQLDQKQANNRYFAQCFSCIAL
ncbi:Protease 4 [Thalassocella blandensis]|nr:Protease 4 [Thalassocella blandensis]